MKAKQRSKAFARIVASAKKQQFYPYFQPIAQSWGPEVEVEGRRLVMAGSNDYLGLTHDPRVVEAAANAVRRWGSGPGGSRFLSGNMTLHDQLEERLAAFVGKKASVVHTTGFLTNLGALGSLITPSDVLLCDRENHASIFEGCRASGAKIVPFRHNDKESAREKILNAKKRYPEAELVFITEGVFSMSGDVSDLPRLVELRDEFPEVLFYLDDAHGLGVMGENGRGTASHFGVVEKMDFIMGTFSKALASIGGFIASDDEDMLCYVKHNSKTLIFSAALPASNVATVLQCLEIMESEPDRVRRLWDVTRRVREGYKKLDLVYGTAESPVIPIHIGEEEKAYRFAAALFSEGVFALPAVFPAVPKGKALIRTAYMSTHEDRHIETVMQVLDKLAGEFKIRATDLAQEPGYAPQFESSQSDQYCAASGRAAS